MRFTPNTQDLVVRDLTEEDLATVDAYWGSLTKADHDRMKVDPAKLIRMADRRHEILERLSIKDSKKASHALIWQYQGNTIGVANLRNLHFGEDGEIHLHIFDPAKRRQGLGHRFFVLSLKKFATRFRLKKIFCEPASTNPAPNQMLRKLGFPLVKTYRTVPGPVCLEHEVNRFEIDCASLDGLLHSLFNTP